MRILADDVQGDREVAHGWCVLQAEPSSHYSDQVAVAGSHWIFAIFMSDQGSTRSRHGGRRSTRVIALPSIALLNRLWIGIGACSEMRRCPAASANDAANELAAPVEFDARRFEQVVGCGVIGLVARYAIVDGVVDGGGELVDLTEHEAGCDAE